MSIYGPAEHYSCSSFHTEDTTVYSESVRRSACKGMFREDTPRARGKMKFESSVIVISKGLRNLKAV